MSDNQEHRRAATAPVSSRSRRISPRVFRLLVLLVGVVALALQLWAPGPTTETIDEPTWLARSDHFQNALQSRKASDASALDPALGKKSPTVPGVTTMWAGVIGRQIARASGGVGLSKPISGPSVESPQVLRAARGVVALWCSLTVMLLIVILDRLFSARVAFITGITLAVEPRLAGYANLLHTDAMITFFSIVAVAALALYLKRPGTDGQSVPTLRPLPWLLVSGAFTALALLTKVSAAGIVIPGALLVIGKWLFDRPRPWFTMHRLRTMAAIVGIWLALIGIVALALYPALWAAPASQFRAMSEATEQAAAGRPVFFHGTVHLGVPIAFYPVNLAFVLSPWCLVLSIGGLITGLGGIVAGIVRFFRGWTHRRRRSGPVVRIVPAWVILAPVPYAAALVLSRFGYSRYALPLVPFAVLAGALTVDYAVNRWIATPAVQRRTVAGVCAAILVLGFYSTVRLAPYSIDYINPLLGGQKTAYRWIPLGWLETQAELADEVRRREPGGCDRIIVGAVYILAASVKCGRHRPISEPHDLSGVDYVITSMTYRQRDYLAWLNPLLLKHATLVDQVKIDGVVYGELWQVTNR